MMIRRLMFMYKKLHLELSTYFQIFFNGCHRGDSGHTTYRKNNNLEKCAGMGLGGFQIR